MSAASEAPSPRGDAGRLLAHSRYVLQDYLLLRASLPFFGVLLIAGSWVMIVTRGATAEWLRNPRFVARAHEMYTGPVMLFVWLGVFLAAVAVMSVDRTAHYYRFLFSKPVNVVWYYVHSYVMHGVAFVALFGAITWSYGHFTADEPVARGVAVAALVFAFIACFGFFFEALTRLGALLTPVIFVIGLSIQQVMADPGASLPRWLLEVNRVLPPARKLELLREGALAGGALESGPLWHVYGYAAAALVLGLVLLRRLPLAR